MIPLIKTVYECSRVKLLGRVLKRLEKVLLRVFKKAGKAQVGLNKNRLKFSRGKMLGTCEKLFFHDKVLSTLRRDMFLFTNLRTFVICVFLLCQ